MAKAATLPERKSSRERVRESLGFARTVALLIHGISDGEVRPRSPIEVRYVCA